MAEVINKIKLETAQKRVRAKEFFMDFDTLRKGEVSEEQFKRAIQMMNLTVTKQDLETLVASYKQANNLVNYRLFLQEVESVFNHESEYSPVKAALETFSPHELSSLQQQQVSEALKVFQNIMKIQRILVKPAFQNFDRANTGHVSASQFIRVLTTLGVAPNNIELKTMMARLYTDSHLGVNYYKFCIDIENSDGPSLFSGNLEGESDPQNKPSLGQDLTATRFFDTRVVKSIEPLEVEVKLRAEVAMKGIRASEFFRDFDGLRKGAVKVGQFCTALNMVGLRMTEAELQSILNKYRQANGDIRYLEFCKFIESAPLILEKLPENRSEGLVSTLPARRKYIGFTDEEAANLEKALDDFRTVIRNRRVHLRPMFQNFDITRSSHVSRTQFCRVLNQLSIYPSEENLRLILKRYIDKGNMEEVNYMDFCLDVDIPDLIYQPVGNSQPNPDEYLEKRKKDFKGLQYTTKPVMEGKITTHHPEDLEDLLSRIRNLVKQQRIRIHEFIRDFDRLRSGFVTMNQIRSAFSMAKLPLSDAEYKLICNHYSLEDQRINYVKLIEDIDNVFTQKRLEKSNIEVILGSTNFKYGSNDLTPNEENLVAQALQRFQRFSVNNLLDLKSHFQDWDRHNSLKISGKQFRQVLAQFKFTFNDEEFQAVCKKYNDAGFVKYIDFLNDSKPRPPSEESREDINLARKAGGFNIHTHYCMNHPMTEDLETLMKRVQQNVKIKRIRAQEFMTEHDPLRKGTIPKAKFRSALDNMKIELSARDIDLLEQYFETAKDLVNYSAFVEICEQVFLVKHLEKNPLSNPSNEVNYLDPRDVLNDQEEVVLENCMKRLGFFVFTKRLHIKPFFQDKDRVNAGWVVSTRFRSVLSFAGITISDQEFEVMSKRFSYKRNEINYNEFCLVLARYSKDDQLF
jgi:Ca2+-binding EF-hand superfamily protein